MNTANQLLETLRTYSGLGTTFAQQQSISMDAHKVLKNMANMVESAHEEYNHSLSSALDANTYSRYKKAVYAKKVVESFNKRQSLKTALQDMMALPSAELEKMASNQSMLNSFVSGAISNYYISNKVRSPDNVIQSETDRIIGNNEDSKLYREYLDNQLRLIIRRSEEEGMVEQVNLLNDIKRDFLLEVSIDKEHERNMGYTPKHTEVTLK